MIVYYVIGIFYGLIFMNNCTTIPKDDMLDELVSLKLPNIISNGMVLQQGENVPIWGWILLEVISPFLFKKTQLCPQRMIKGNGI